MRVLVVDDEVVLADGLRKGLTAEGFAVDVAHDGPAGLEKALVADYDVILVDLLMPGMTGWEVCGRLRAREVWTPVMVLTAKDGEWDQVDALEAGADDYLTKPFSFVVLVARIHALMRRGARERPAVHTVGGLRIDPARHRVWHGDTAVELTAREFAVLEYLARDTGVVVSKRAILENVWDEHFDGDPNIVEVYVARLRTKLRTVADGPAIVTVRGAGYRLDADR